MIRDSLVRSLYKKLLGPEFGPEEEVEFPFAKYAVGIISTSFVPQDSTEYLTDSTARDDPEFKISGISLSNHSEAAESTDEAFEDFQESSLDPRVGSKSMGVSFVVSAIKGNPKISICCTWARYELKDGYDRYEYGLFRRVPNFFITKEIEISDSPDQRIDLSSDSFCLERNVTRQGLILHIRKRSVSSGKNMWAVSVFLENKTPYNVKTDKREHDEHRVFQPQIRVVCSPGTKTEFFEEQLVPEPNSADAKDMLAYLERSSKARGHQCGAIWKDVDPESDLTEFSKCMWTESDNDNFPKWAKEKFTAPDVRTEYFPSYTILQPNLSDKPEFEAEKLAEMWTANEFRYDKDNGLDVIVAKYSDWISEREKDLQEMSLHSNLRETALSNLLLCKESLERIKRGIAFICDDPRARLAFCFMNKAMSLKMRWDNRSKSDFSGFRWREFQMAFILQSLRGVAGVDNKENRLCDVLWFPTGGGKTEAYLGLSLFTVAYRRLTKFQDYENDGGVTVISRYTLRLLTIQQFSRACSATLAADILRVENWVPSTVKRFDDDELQRLYDSGHIWGLSRISIGLWIGGGITPNRFPLYKSWNGNCTRNAAGSLAPHLADDDPTCINPKNSGEPAQISNCPCCNNVLATHSLKRNTLSTITWLIKSTKNLQELSSLTVKDFDSRFSHIKINKIQFTAADNTFSEDDSRYLWFTADIAVLSDEPDDVINKWWKNTVVPKVSRTESDPLMSTSASRPGYFFVKDSNGRPFDYSIHCTNPECRLNKKGTRWFEAPVNNMVASIAFPFRDPNDPHYSSSIPISAFTVDDQVYSKCPTFLIATADKFARIPFELRSASIFGNVDVFHKIYGYGRDGRDGIGRREEIYMTPLDEGKKPKKLDPADFSRVLPFSPPNLIIQDELHLIEGALGSMVGIYEMAVDLLCTNNRQSPKYIASSATIKEAKSQVAAVYRRDVRVFPQPAISYSDSYFAQLREDVSSTDEGSGRLYLGVCAGIGTYTIPVKIWAALLSQIYQIRNNPTKKEYGLVEKFEKEKGYLKKNGIKSFEEFVERETDVYWTLVGFFSDLELLARTSSFYLDDIYRDVKSFSPQSLQNIISRGRGEKKSRGVRFYKILPTEPFSVSSVSVFCQKEGGRISVGIFDDDQGKPGKKITVNRKPDSSHRCVKGENIFELENSVGLKENSAIWVGIISYDNECYFQTGDKIEYCYTDTSFIQNSETRTAVDAIDFTRAVSSATKQMELPIRIALKSKFRDLDHNRKIEMSSRTPATELPSILDRLNKIPNDIDALLTTPIFGTGIDINRLGLMVVMNQPKTTSQYIQATGRVGRNCPGLVVSWLKSGRYRDLNHYENFVGYHRAIHRYVEPITASPFSEKTMDVYLGPVIVALLRTGRTFDGVSVPVGWVPNANGSFVLQNKDSDEIRSIRDLMKNLSCSTIIPEIRRLSPPFFEEYFARSLRRWELAAKSAAEENKKLAYYDYSYMYSSEVRADVVLGSPAHKIQKKKIAFQNVKTSLREVESQTSFGERLMWLR